METGSHIRLIIWKAAKAVEKVDRSSIQETVLCLSDFAILEALLHKGPLTISQLGAKVLLSSGSMTAAVNRLEKSGLVKRIQDASDGRVFHVHLTPKGKKIISEAYDKHRKNLDKVAAVLTGTEKTELVRLLKKIGRHAETLGEKYAE